MNVAINANTIQYSNALTIRQIDRDMDKDKHANTRWCQSLPCLSGQLIGNWLAVYHSKRARRARIAE